MTPEEIKRKLDQAIVELTTLSPRLSEPFRGNANTVKDGLKEVRAEFDDNVALIDTLLHDVPTDDAIDAVESFALSAGLDEDIVDRLSNQHRE